MSKMGGKIFAVGDIHGCYAKLCELMARLPYTPGTDQLVFLGDYINRGPDSARVLDYLCELRQNDPGMIALLGNHEYLLLEYLRSHDPALVPYLRTMKIDATQDSYGSHGAMNPKAMDFLPPDHLAFFKTLKPYWETAEYIFVHAGVEVGIPLAANDLPALCEARDSFIVTEHDFGRRVIFGHTPFELPLVTPTKIGIDTGAVYGNLLTAIELPGGNFYHA